MPADPKSASDWQDLLRIAQGSELTIERVRIPEKQITVEGQFTLPELARLSLEDQVFVVAFIRSHGTISGPLIAVDSRRRTAGTTCPDQRR